MADGSIVQPAPKASPASQQPNPGTMAAGSMSEASQASQQPDLGSPAEPLSPAEGQEEPGVQQLALANPMSILTVGEMVLPIVAAAHVKDKGIFESQLVVEKFKDMDTTANAAWMLLGCVQCKGQAAHEVQYPHLIKVTQLDLLVRKEAAGLLQRMIEWMAKRANTLAAAAGEGQQWPFVAGAFREFCRLLAETETIPQHPFTMWMRIHEVRGKPPPQAVKQAATEGLQHCSALLTQLEARLLFFPL